MSNFEIPEQHERVVERAFENVLFDLKHPEHKPASDASETVVWLFEQAQRYHDALSRHRELAKTHTWVQRGFFAELKEKMRKHAKTDEHLRLAQLERNYRRLEQSIDGHTAYETRARLRMAFKKLPVSLQLKIGIEDATRWANFGGRSVT